MILSRSPAYPEEGGRDGGREGGREGEREETVENHIAERRRQEEKRQK